MARIKIPGGEESLIHKASEGDLVLVIAGRALSCDPPCAMTFGIFKKLRTERRKVQRDNRMFPDRQRPPVEIKTQVVVVDPAYTLKPYQELGGIKIPIVSQRPCTPAEFALYRGRKCVELYFGKRNITAELSKWEEFQPHAEWIARLRKPYL